MLRLRLLIVGLIAASWMSQTRADEKPTPEPLPDYVRLTAEIRGTLRVDTGIMRVHVFLWGSCLTVFYDNWDLDFGKDEVLRKKALKLEGKTVLVTGTARNPTRIGMDSKPVVARQTVAVRSIVLAPEK